MEEDEDREGETDRGGTVRMKDEVVQCSLFVYVCVEKLKEKERLEIKHKMRIKEC